jgi:hypothetical protein
MAAQQFVLTQALGARMSDVMRRALASTLLQPENGHSTPLLNRFLSKALELAPGAEIEAFMKRANQMWGPLRRMLPKASTLPVTPALVAAAQAACSTFEPRTPLVALGVPADWIVFVVLALDGSRASADALLAVVRAQEGAADRAGDANLRCAAAATAIAKTGKTPAFAHVAERLGAMVIPAPEGE